MFTFNASGRRLMYRGSLQLLDEWKENRFDRCAKLRFDLLRITTVTDRSVFRMPTHFNGWTAVNRFFAEQKFAVGNTGQGWKITNGSCDEGTQTRGDQWDISHQHARIRRLSRGRTGRQTDFITWKRRRTAVTGRDPLLGSTTKPSTARRRRTSARNRWWFLCIVGKWFTEVRSWFY